ncbi:hypothetical protein [Telmatospirillum sp.]|uniref:hypothetical protein n=1 Tax=Telmatospirillum sp. TaxID=2079197 RepID=UPI002849D11F|nr:hypothetical protein [Telmatospirillum sp.]MDR3439441.1 hypothetical protein [Telmatospirillum sp.]
MIEAISLLSRAITSKTVFHPERLLMVFWGWWQARHGGAVGRFRLTPGDHQDNVRKSSRNSMRWPATMIRIFGSRADHTKNGTGVAKAKKIMTMTYLADVEKLIEILDAELRGNSIDRGEALRLVTPLRQECPDIASSLALIGERLTVSA